MYFLSLGFSLEHIFSPSFLIWQLLPIKTTSVFSLDKNSTRALIPSWSRTPFQKRYSPTNYFIVLMFLLFLLFFFFPSPFDQHLSHSSLHIFFDASS